MLNIKLTRAKGAVHRVRFATRDHVLSKQLRPGSRVGSVVEEGRTGTVRSVDDAWVYVCWDAGVSERVDRRTAARHLTVLADQTPPKPAARRVASPTPAAAPAQADDELGQLLSRAVRAGIIDDDDREMRRIELEASPEAVAALRAEVEAAGNSTVVNADPAAVSDDPEMTEADRALARIRAGGGGSFGGGGGSFGGGGFGGGGGRSLADAKADREAALDVDGFIADPSGGMDAAFAQLAANLHGEPPPEDDAAELIAELAPPARDRGRRTATKPRRAYVPPGLQKESTAMSNLNGPTVPLVINNTPFKQSLGESLSELGWTTLSGGRR